MTETDAPPRLAPETREIAREAAREMLLLLGLDAREPREVQADFLFLRTQREAAERFHDNLRRTGWSLLAAAILGFGGWLIAAVRLHWGSH